MFRRIIAAATLGIVAITLPHRASAETTFEAAKRSGRISIAFYNQFPWGYRTPDGKIAGEAIDVVTTVFTRIGIKEFDPVVSEFSSLIPGLLAKRFDAAGVGLYITPERCKLVIFGDPDIRMPDGVIVRKGNPHKISKYEDIAANKDLKLGTARGNAQAQNAQLAGIPASQILLFPDNSSALSALLAGRVDAVSATAASIVGLVRDAKDADVQRVVPFTGFRDAQGNEKVGYPGVAFRPEDTDFREAYNAELAKMKKDGTLLEIIKRYGFDESDLPGDKTATQLCSP